MPRAVGYEFLRESLETGAHPQSRPAAVYPVIKITPMADYLQVPNHVAPPVEAPALDHLLFALKHEVFDIQASILALKRINGQELTAVFEQAPSSVYIRKACYLWEIANGVELQCGRAEGGYTKLFDPEQFITGNPQRSAKWRVEFNGIGSPYYSPVVRRTPEITRLLQKNILQESAAYVASLDKEVLDRAVRWAYLSETNGSYEIEKEHPSPSRQEAFASLLAHAHEPIPITEDYLVQLQNATVTNGLDRAAEYRNEQNWLRGGQRGALGVTYVPPPPAAVPAIMREIENLANGARTSGIDPLVMGAVVSFAFVYAHPFMDGNGRLSRFLFHRVVCGSDQLPNGLVLPISVAMKRHEADYITALKSFSRPARSNWDVQWIDGNNFNFTFKGELEMYRYWDATPCVEFGMQMAQEALDRDLRAEAVYLERYDKVYREVNKVLDMRSNELAELVQFAIQNEGVLPKRRIKQFVADGHKESVLHLARDVISKSYREDARHVEREEIERRLDRLQDLNMAGGAAHTFGRIALEEVEDCRTVHSIDWDEVHRDTAIESMKRNNQSAESVLSDLLQHSPGAVTKPDQVALQRLIDDVVRDLTAAEAAPAKGLEDVSQIGQIRADTSSPAR